jgi:hypothetical protein
VTLIGRDNSSIGRNNSSARLNKYRFLFREDSKKIIGTVSLDHCVEEDGDIVANEVMDP